MAKNKVQYGRKGTAEAVPEHKFEFPLKKQNFYYILVGVAVIIVGYLLMATGITEQPAVPDGKWNNIWAVDIAPVLLVIGYCVIIPIGILKKFNKNN